MKKLSLDEFMRLRRMVFRGARPLEFVKWRYLFENGDIEDVLFILSSYQNEDGGFGHELECNCWNPNSSPYVTDLAIIQLDRIEYSFSDNNHPILRGILRYLAAGEYLTETGWLGMDCVPSNNDYSHLPWFHNDPQKGSMVDIDITNHLADFIIKYADSDSELYRKAVALKAKHESSAKAGTPDFSSFNPTDPASWQPWLPMPVTFVGSPDSDYYSALQKTVDLQLDTMVDRLQKTDDFMIMTDEELDEWEKNNPRLDGKRWGDRYQTIGNYYWGSDSVIQDIVLLRKFGRLDFQLPIQV
ncbi:MAG: hypothetical protein LBU61_01370 [Coriobacteriales bacterium]|jgi:hypothetical protein|nr:hypothetical protein [Coriobacteriales bacterium]